MRLFNRVVNLMSYESVQHLGRSQAAFVMEPPQNVGGEEDGDEVGDGDAEPNTLRSPQSGEDEQEGDEEDELAAERQEDAGLCHTELCFGLCHAETRQTGLQAY